MRNVNWPFALLAAMAASVPGTALAAPGADAPTWITLGTAGGPPIQIQQSQIANALVVGKAIYLFDVGEGTLRQMAAAKLPVRDIKAVFLSHHHIDHNAELDPIMVQHWLFGTGKPLPVIGPNGTVTLVKGLADANAATELASFPTDPSQIRPALRASFAPHDVPPTNTPKIVYDDGTIRVSAISVAHYQVKPAIKLDQMPQAIAYRVEAGVKTFVFSGDTGPTANLAILARDADVLITEVVDVPAISRALSHMPGPAAASIAAGMSHNHLTPAAIGDIAATAHVKQVVLTHYVPGFADEPNVANYTRDIKARFAGPVVLAHDLDRF